MSLDAVAAAIKVLEASFLHTGDFSFEEISIDVQIFDFCG